MTYAFYTFQSLLAQHFWFHIYPSTLSHSNNTTFQTFSVWQTMSPLPMTWWAWHTSHNTCPVSSAHLNDFLRCFFSIISSVAADSQRRLGQLISHRWQRTLNEVFGVVGLHEDLRRLAQPARARLHAVEHLRWYGNRCQRHVPTPVNRLTHNTAVDKTSHTPKRRPPTRLRERTAARLQGQGHYAAIRPIMNNHEHVRK